MSNIQIHKHKLLKVKLWASNNDQYTQKSLITCEPTKSIPLWIYAEMNIAVTIVANLTYLNWTGKVTWSQTAAILNIKHSTN